MAQQLRAINVCGWMWSDHLLDLIVMVLCPLLQMCLAYPEAPLICVLQADMLSEWLCIAPRVPQHKCILRVWRQALFQTHAEVLAAALLCTDLVKSSQVGCGIKCVSMRGDLCMT